MQFIAGFYGAEVTTRARGGLVDKAWDNMYIVYNIRLGLIRITLDYFEDSFVFHFASIEYRIHISFQMGRCPMGLLEVKSVEWRIDQAAFLGEEWGRDPKASQRSRLEVFRSHYRSQCLFEWFFWHVIAICHLWCGARFGDVSEVWDAPTSTDLLLRVINFKRVL